MAKKTSMKKQGSSAKSGSKGRSLGSEYAYAVKGALAKAKSIKGSKSAFLGKKTKTIKTKKIASEKTLKSKK
jgi:hypothetical protein